MKTRKYSKRRVFSISTYIGLILGLILIGVFVSFGLLKKDRCIPLMYLDNDFAKDPYLDLYHNNLPAKRLYKEFVIGTKPDSIFCVIKDIVMQINNSKDTVNGVKLVFNKEIKYGQYIKTINLILQCNSKTFVPYGDTIFVYYLNRYDEYDDLDKNIAKPKVYII